MGARYFRLNDSIWESPTTRHVESMLAKHGMTSANPVVTAEARNDDEGDAEASTEAHQEAVPGSTKA